MNFIFTGHGFAVSLRLISLLVNKYVVYGTSVCFTFQMFGKLNFRKRMNDVVCQMAAFALLPNLSFPNIKEMEQTDMPLDILFFGRMIQNPAKCLVVGTNSSY